MNCVDTRKKLMCYGLLVLGDTKDTHVRTLTGTHISALNLNDRSKTCALYLGAFPEALILFPIPDITVTAKPTNLSSKFQIVFP